VSEAGAAPARISLDGDSWELKGYLGEDWRWRDAHLPQSKDRRHWITGRVPGTVQHDLWLAGAIANPYRGRNSLLAEWAPQRTWLYRRAFTVGEDLRGSRVQLSFEGIDYEGAFYLNGELLGTHRSMFTPARFEVGELLRYGEENLLAVVLEPAPPEQPQVGRTSRVRTHKSRMTYWWDFCPRMVHLGIWDEVWLKATGAVRIDALRVRATLDHPVGQVFNLTDSSQPQGILRSEDSAQDDRGATVTVTLRLSSAGERAARVALVVRDGEREAARREVDVTLPEGESEVQLALALPDAELWWPNGYGAQKLYEVVATVAVRGEEGWVTSDAERGRFGVREVRFEANEGAPDGARPYRLVVNGQPIYLKGWNWVPIDVMYGVPRPEKRRHLLRLAQRAHVTMLRVWGGGLIEQEAFYDLCDELGILVWQEFIQSSSGIEDTPPDDPDFLAFMRAEAEAIVPRKANHPSLALWGGGNELQDAKHRPAGESQPLLALLREVVSALDPERTWLPTSPTGPTFGNAVENIAADPDGQHDVHGPWIYQGLEKQYTLANMGTSLLHSEFGVEGITNLSTLEWVAAGEALRPVSRDHPFWEHLGAWWVWDERWRTFWGDIEALSLPQLVRATQFIQAEGLRYAVEANRRRWPRHSGSFPWQFNEPYPMAACTSAVDYFGQPKPVYYAVARAYAPVSVTAQFDRIAWGGYEQVEETVWGSGIGDRGSVEARVVNRWGEVVERSAAFQAAQGRSGMAGAHARRSGHPCPRSVEVLRIEAALDRLEGEVFFLDLVLRDEGGAVLARNRYPFSKTENLAPFLSLEETELAVSGEKVADGYLLAVENVGPVAAVGVWVEALSGYKPDLPAFVYYDDNYFTLLPGERREVRVEMSCYKPDLPERRLRISSWNSAEVVYG
jgi:beta-mannosidase